MSAENPNYLNELLDAEMHRVRLRRLKRTLAASTITVTCFSAGCMALSSETTPSDKVVDVAIVPFEMDVDDATELAETIETSFNDVADGMVTIDVSVIKPSSAAERRYQETNSDNCVDKSDLLNYGSYVAEAAMPELNTYDKILALNADPACQGEVGGVAQLQGRYGEVFNAASTWDVIESNGGATMQRKSSNGNAVTTTYLYSPAGTGVHEMFHLFGLGHNGVLLPPKDRVKGEMYTMRIFSESPRDVTVDVRAFIARQTYDEYGSVEVMGKGILDLTNGLTVLEKHILSEVRQPSNPSVEAHVLSGEPLDLALNASTESIVTHQLKTPIKLQNKDETRAMTSLAFVPKGANDPLAVKGLSVYLLSDDNNSMEIGELMNIGEAETTYILQLDTGVVTVHLDYTDERATLTLQAEK